MEVTPVGMTGKEDECKTIMIVWTTYFEKKVIRFEVEKMFPCLTFASVKLRAKEVQEEEGESPHCGAVVSLMGVAAMSRPDITSSVHDVAKHMHAPTEEH